MLVKQKAVLAVAFAMTKKFNQSGYAVLEIMLAFALVVVIITGMVSLGVSSVKAVTTNRANSAAGKVAQREVDRLKLLRDTSTDWEAFYNAVAAGSACAAGCYINMSSPISAAVGHGTSFTGADTVTYSFVTSSLGNNRISYIVTTTWSIGAVAKSYKIEGVLTNWKEV